MNSESNNARRVGVVVIGRNEGERLRRCLRLLADQAAMVVYVDSGSTDGSVEVARSFHADVLALDMTRPFTAARARNAGLARLREIFPGVWFVQFLDGDCAVAAGWLDVAAAAITSDDKVAVICGRLRERFPEASVYNRLCDLEWDAPVGEISSCGGNAMMRIAAIEEVGTFDPAMIAGEEPELCARLRANGWRIRRVDAEMALHDAAMTLFSQWWRRLTRGGHAIAEGAWLHGRTTQRDLVRRLVSIVLWAGVLPVIAIAMAWATNAVSLLVLAGLYAALWTRMVIRQRLRGRPLRPAALYATFIIIGKFAELSGIIRFFIARLLRRSTRIIEYKTPNLEASVVSGAE